MTYFSMKLHGVCTILCRNTFLSLYSSRKLQIIDARHKDIDLKWVSNLDIEI